MTVSAVIIDDEPLARRDLELELSQIPGVDIKMSCENGFDGLRAIQDFAPDVVFLDIQMPGLDGFEMLHLVDPDKLPPVVFVTAYDQHAIRAFEEKAYDYILKPARKERLEEALAKATRARPPAVELAEPSLLRVPCRIGKRVRLIAPETIEAARTELAGVTLLTEDGPRETDVTLGTLESRFGMFRTHKQYVVTLSRIEEIRMTEGGCAELTLRGGERVPVSRRYVRALKQKLGLA
ncbi:MAG: two-component system response regulator BtsR [Myxococcota bacterium]